MYNPVYFRAPEWRCKCGKPGCPAGAKPLADPVLKFLDLVRAALGAPIEITSGWRCPAHNAATPGAAQNSLHLRGRAADIKAANMDDLAAIVRRLAALPDISPGELQIKRGYIHVGFK